MTETTLATEVKALTRLEMQAEILRLTIETARLKADMGKVMTMKVSEKGAISFYGFGRFPITIYVKNLLTLFERMDEIKAFIDANKEKLVWCKKAE